MNHLTRSLLEGLLEEDKKIVALYGGGFKPPIGGHFEVVEEALKQYPEIDELIILVGGGERNGISQAEAILIWEIYQDYLPPKVKIQPSKMPIGDIYSFAKNNPQDIVYWIIGRREGADDDNRDIVDRAKALKKNPEKYDNLDLKVITTQDEGMRGRNAREAAKKGKLYFTPFLPKKLSKEDKSKVFDIVSPVLKENATYSQNIDYKQMIQDLTDYMIKKGRNIEPLPKVEFIDGDSENAKDFFGKTAYYDPNTQTIVLYTEGRHPKDIVRSFSHEMVHHTQFLEDRLGDVQTTDTTEDDNLDKIEQEANLVGTMTFRNWTDSIKEKKNKDPFGITAYALELARGLEEEFKKENNNILESQYGIPPSKLINLWKKETTDSELKYFCKRDNCGPAAIDFGNWAQSLGIKLKRVNGFFHADKVVSGKRDFTDQMKQEFLNQGGNFDSAEEREEWVANSKYSDQWKFIPHYWLEDNKGTVYDPVGQEQFIDAGYAKDLNPNRYSLTDDVNEELNEGDTYEKMAAKGKKAGNLKQGTVRKRLGIKKGEKVPMYKINKELARLRKMDKDKDKKGVQLGDKNQKYYKALQLAKTLKTTTNVNEADPKKGTGKKPKGSGRRLYTDEDPSDTVGIKFSTRQDVVNTLNKASFKNKSHARQSQIINLIHQRIRAALGRTKDPKKKKKLQSAFNYIKQRKEASKRKTQRLKKKKLNEKKGYGKSSSTRYRAIYKKDGKFYFMQDNPFSPGIRQEFGPYKTKEAALKKMGSFPPGTSYRDITEQKTYKIYSDMDGVLVDFDKRFKRFSDGIPPTEYEQKFGRDKFWEIIDGTGVRFWVGMDWMSDGKQLWNYIKEYNPTLLSSPSRSNYSRMGKRIWRKRNLPSTKLILARAANKQNYADPNSILIDDRESNIDQWIKAGGIGILHTDTASTISKLKELGL